MTSKALFVAVLEDDTVYMGGKSYEKIYNYILMLN
jgi:hypothetical protein